jgi:hypothetical protein
MPLSLFFNKQGIHILSIRHNINDTFSLKTLPICNLAGIEPGSAVPQADAMHTVPRSQGYIQYFLANAGDSRCKIALTISVTIKSEFLLDINDMLTAKLLNKNIKYLRRIRRPLRHAPGRKMNC